MMTFLLKLLLLFFLTHHYFISSITIREWREMKPKFSKSNPKEDKHHLFTQASGSHEELWDYFKDTFKKVYSSFEEEAHRFKIFSSNAHYVSDHNADKTKSFKLGLNEYADLSSSEIVRTMNGFRRTYNLTSAPRLQNFDLPLMGELPKIVDWRDKGAVTPVKNQKNCGSCWAFSSTGALEGQHFLSTGKMVSLSEQNLVDCSIEEGNNGCEGGLMDQAFLYVKKNGGIDTEKSYPYEGRDRKCRYNSSTVGATDTGYVDIPTEDETALKNAVASIGPISVAIDAGHSSFHFYSSGVYDEPRCSQENLDHGVLAVGYGVDSEAGKDYWLVKNSWGKTWGEDGYVKMRRNHKNQCGIATQASYPVVKKNEP